MMMGKRKQRQRKRRGLPTTKQSHLSFSILIHALDHFDLPTEHLPYGLTFMPAGEAPMILWADVHIHRILKKLKTNSLLIALLP